MLDRDPTKAARSNVLLLGISYPCVESQMKKRGFPQDILTYKEPSVEQAVECVRRGILTEMDARDLARCVATEQVTDTDVYTVSKEIGAVYRSDRHVHANFNARNFCQTLRDQFGPNIQFSQVILDYYWMPTGWLVTRWAKTLFQQTLPDLVRNQMLTFPSRRKKRGSAFEEGVVYLPFCAHVCKELVGAINILQKYYAITFVHKKDLPSHSLWKGTMSIDGHVMQTRLGKRLDQEEVYCTFRPKDIYESMEDAHVSKPAVMKVLLAIENYDDIRMIKLRPLRQHEKASVFRERLFKNEVGGFIGLNYNLASKKSKKKQAVSPSAAKEPTPPASSEKLQAKPRKAIETSPPPPKRDSRLRAAPKATDMYSDTPSKPRAKSPVKPQNNKNRKSNRKQSSKPTPVSPKNIQPAYYDVEEPDAQMVKKFCYFPGPTKDLSTYDNPREESTNMNDPEVSPSTSKPPEMKVEKEETTPAELKNLGVVHLSEDEREQRQPQPPASKEFLAFNPRNPPQSKKTETQNLLASKNMSHPNWAETPVDLDWPLVVPEIQRKLDENVPKVPKYDELEAASTLFFCVLKGIDTMEGVERLNGLEMEKGRRVKTATKQETACFVLDDHLSFEDIGGYKLESAESLRRRMGDIEIPIKSVVLVCRGQVEHLLDKGDQDWMASTRRSYFPKRKSGKMVHTRAAVERVQHLNDIVRWLLSGRQEQYDPSGCLRLIELDLKTRPHLSIGKLAAQIETSLNKHLKAFSESEEALDVSSELELATQWFLDFAEIDSSVERETVVMSLRDLESKRRQLKENALQWLERKSDAHDPTGEFLQVEGKMPIIADQSLEQRAEQLAEKVEGLRNIIYFVQSAEHELKGSSSISFSETTKKCRRKARHASEQLFVDSLALIPCRATTEWDEMEHDAESLLQMRKMVKKPRTSVSKSAKKKKKEPKGMTEEQQVTTAAGENPESSVERTPVSSQVTPDECITDQGSPSHESAVESNLSQQPGTDTAESPEFSIKRKAAYLADTPSSKKAKCSSSADDGTPFLERKQGPKRTCLLDSLARVQPSPSQAFVNEEAADPKFDVLGRITTPLFPNQPNLPDNKSSPDSNTTGVQISDGSCASQGSSTISIPETTSVPFLDNSGNLSLERPVTPGENGGGSMQPFAASVGTNNSA
eukprot:Nitzschia sp. Nitz4//scaffold15_size197535//167603//171173//NITZ4_001605-RA/size197535-augustus-gene-0.216-mRNA-1//1//CDS//3329537796//7148//frame0